MTQKSYRPHESKNGHRARRTDGRQFRRLGRLDRVADRAQDRADLVAQEDERDDRDDRDEREDQRVLRETLAFLVTAKRGEKRGKESHAGCLLDEYSPPDEGRVNIERGPATETETMVPPLLRNTGTRD